ncbi:MAG: hypothetical protein DMD28_09435 [Gemmatimonadetes bacterium]|nr:MAG: hypothetical protein DMD28_09435 [Gemmatimonadota bacterium]
MIQGPPIPPGFDPNFFFTQAAPTVGLVAVILVGALGLRWLFGTVVGEALAERIRQGSRRRRHWKGFGGEWLDVPGETPAESGRVAALEEQVNLLHSQVSELAERLDFAERLLAERRERKLTEGPHGNL